MNFVTPPEPSRLLRLPAELRCLIYDYVFPYNWHIIHCLRYIYWDPEADRPIPGIMLANWQLYEEVRAHIFKTHTFVAHLGVLPPMIMKTGDPKKRVTEGLKTLAKTIASMHHLDLQIDLEGDESSVFLLRYFQHCLNAAAQPLKTLQMEFMREPIIRGAQFEALYSVSLPQECMSMLRHHYSSHQNAVYAARHLRCARPPILKIPAGVEKFCPHVCTMLRQSYREDGPMMASGVEVKFWYWSDDDSMLEEATKLFYKDPQSSTASASVQPQRKKGFKGRKHSSRCRRGEYMRQQDEKRKRREKRRRWLDSLVGRLRKVFFVA